MSLEKCRECKKEISSEVKVCPNCGVKNPFKKKRTWKFYALLIFIVFIVVSIMDNKYADKSINTANLIKDDKSLFTEKELKVYTAIVKDDLRNLVNSGKSVYSKNVKHLIVSANTIQRDYEKNEINADLKYKNKDLIVNGKIKSIKKDVYNNPYLELYGGTNQFLSPNANFNDKYINWLSSLKRNQKVKIVCLSSKLFGGSVYLEDCIPSNDWIENTTINIINSTPLLLDDKILKLQDTIELIKIITPKLKETSACFNNKTNSCIKEIEKIIPTIKKEIQAIKNK